MHRGQSAIRETGKPANKAEYKEAADFFTTQHKFRLLSGRHPYKYAWIAKHKTQWPVTLTCEVLAVSASGYFEHWRRKDADKPSKPGANKRFSDEALLVHIKAIHAEVKQEYGWPRMWKELLARGIRVGKDRVRKLMQRHGIKARGKRKFVVTTDSKHSLPIAPNLLQRNFTPTLPNTVWTSDITYIATDEGWLYLTAVIDLFSRLVVDRRRACGVA
jgi:putative transposase